MGDKFVKEIELKADGAGKASQNINKAGKAVENVDKKTEKLNKSFSKMAKSAAGLGALILIAKKIGKELVEMTKEAIDAQETISKFSQVFRDVANQSEQMAKNLSDNYGLARVESKKLLSDTGDLLTGFGFTQEAALELSSEVNKLAVDLASFTNIEGGAQKASTALTKALLGESEQAKALGIVIRQDSEEYIGLVQHYMEAEGASLLQAKALTAIEIATRQSQNAIGDFGRTQDQTANKIRTAKAAYADWRIEMGNNFIPIVDKAAGSIEEFFKRATETDLETTIRQLEEMGGNLALINKLASMNDVNEATKNLRKNYNAINKAIQVIPASLQLSNKELREFAKTVFGLQSETDEFGEILPIKDSAEFAENLQVAINEANNRYMEQSIILSEINNVNSAKFKKQEKHLDDVFQEWQYLNQINATYEEYMLGVLTLEKAQERINELKKAESETGKVTTENTKEQVVVVKELTDEYVKVGGVVSGLGEEVKLLLDIIYAYGDAAGEVLMGISQIWENTIESRLQKELTALKASTAYQKAEYDKRRTMEEDLNASYAEERTKRAKFNKAVSLAEVAIDTASAVMKTFEVDPSGALAIATGILGLVQAGIIASEPIPAYASGVYADTPRIALIGERGPEGVLNAQATENVGGRAGVEALNRGEGFATTIINNYYNVGHLYGTNEYIDLLGMQLFERSEQGFNFLKTKFDMF